MSTQEKLIHKVKKLLAMANDKGASQNEAEVALKKANKMLLQHNLTFSDVELSVLQNDVMQSDKSQLHFGQIKEEGQWEAPLLNVLCKYNLCHSIKHITPKVYGGKLSVIGKKDNVEIVLYLFESAKFMFRRLSKQAYNSHRKSILDRYKPQGLTEKDCLSNKLMGYRMPWIRSYLKGCVVGIGNKMELEKAEVQQSIDGSKYAVMCTNNLQAIDNFINDRIPNLKTSQTTMQVSNDHGAFKDGVDAGKSTNLTRAVDGKQRSQRTLNLT